MIYDTAMTVSLRASASTRSSRPPPTRPKEGRRKGLPPECEQDLLSLHRGEITYESFLERWGAIVERIAKYFKERRCYVTHEVEDLVQYALTEIAIRVPEWDPQRDRDVTDPTDEAMLAASIGKFIYYGIGRVITQEIKRSHGWPKKGKDGKKKAPLVHYPIDFDIAMSPDNRGQSYKAIGSGLLPGSLGDIRSALSADDDETMVRAIDVDRVLRDMSDADQLIFTALFQAHATSRSLLRAAEELCASGDSRLVGVRPDTAVARYQEILVQLDPDAPSRVRGLEVRRNRRRQRTQKEFKIMQSLPYARPTVLQSYQHVVGQPAPQRAKTTELIATIQQKFAELDPHQVQTCVSCERSVPTQYARCAFCGAVMPHVEDAEAAGDADPATMLARLDSFDSVRDYVTGLYTGVLESSWDFAQALKIIHDDKIWQRWGHVSFQAFIRDCRLAHATVYAYLRVAQNFTREQFLAANGEYTKLAIIACKTGEEQEQLLSMIAGGATQAEIRQALRGRQAGAGASEDGAPDQGQPDADGAEETDGDTNDGADEDEDGTGSTAATRAAPPMPEELRPPAPEPGRGGHEIAARAVSVTLTALTEPTEIPMLSRRANGGLARGMFDPDDCYIELSQGSDDQGRPVVVQLEFQTDELGNILPLVVRHYRIAG